MKEGLKKPLRAFALLSLFEVAVVLAVGTIAWAIAKHDLGVLDRSFYESLRTDLYAQIVGGLVAAIVIVNAIGMLFIVIKGEKLVAFAALVMTGMIASLLFLPMRFTIFGLGGVIGLAIAYKLLRVCWAGLSWPFKKIFGRKPKDAKPPKIP